MLAKKLTRPVAKYIVNIKLPYGGIGHINERRPMKGRIEMLEFLKSYYIWIVLGLPFLFMLGGRARGGGGCCGGGGSHQHVQETPEKRKGQQDRIPRCTVLDATRRVSICGGGSLGWKATRIKHG